jgi:outer membrane protein assembly factor BamB
LSFSSVVTKRWRVALAFALLALVVLVGCVPLPTDPSWASITVLPETGQIMLGFHDRVTLLDVTTGQLVPLRNDSGQTRVDGQGNPLRWDIPISNNPPTVFYSAPVRRDENTLLFPTFQRRIIEVDIRNAQVLNPPGTLIDETITATNHIVTDVLATEDALYIPLSERNLIAVSRIDYSVLWTFETRYGVWVQPQMIDDMLYFTSLDHNFYAVDAETGREIWQVSLGGAAPGKPVFHEGYFYVGSFANRLYKISLEGRIVADVMTNDWVWGSPAIATEDELLYVGDSSGWLYALDIRGDGMQLLWQRQVATRVIRATPIIDGNTLIVASRDRFVYWLSRDDGVETFRRELRGEIYANMVVVEPSETVRIPEPYLLVSSQAREELLVAYSLATGEVQWRYNR